MKDEIDQPIKQLMNSLPQTGKLHWIGIRKQKKELPTVVNRVNVSVEMGLEGDHFSSKSSKKRQVTLIQKEHLDGVASLLGVDHVDPSLTRRNLVIQGINLFALRNRKFSIGNVIFEGTGYCHPCSRMEENLGEGGYNAMRGHGGITAKVISGGSITLGDAVNLIS